jgi:siroheme synthase (precorrin-2 oxidase/ferrochelatase)
MTIPFDFKEFLKLLEARGVEYLVIGGYAVAYHGYPRPTADFDIWVSSTKQNAQKVYQVLNEFGFPIDGITNSTFCEEGIGARMGIPPLRLEILTFATGLIFNEAFKNRLRAKLDEVEVNLISLTDLKRNKLAAGRNKDLADLDHLPGGILESKGK